MFDQYRIPKDALLNKTGDVTIDGNYITPFRDSNKKYGASLGALSMGRVTITSISSCYLNKALTIAIRYAAVRKQFGPEDGEEIPILEYQSHVCILHKLTIRFIQFESIIISATSFNSIFSSCLRIENICIKFNGKSIRFCN